MSIHSSLRMLGGKTGAFRNVLKRHERLRVLITQGRWSDGQSVLGLPKLKSEKRKVKKAAPKEAAASSEASSPAAQAPAAK